MGRRGFRGSMVGAVYVLSGAGGTGIHRVWEAAHIKEDIQHERGPGG